MKVQAEAGSKAIKKNNAIEFYRFVFVWIVCLLHFRGWGDFGDQPTAFLESIWLSNSSSW